MKTFDIGDRIVFRESETGEPEHGVVLEVVQSDQYPDGGLYNIELDGTKGATEAWVYELTAEEDFCKDNPFGDYKHQITDGSCDQCGAKNFN